MVTCLQLYGLMKVCIKKAITRRGDMYVCVCILGTVMYTFCKVCMYVHVVKCVHVCWCVRVWSMFVCACLLCKFV